MGPKVGVVPTETGPTAACHRKKPVGQERHIRQRINSDLSNESAVTFLACSMPIIENGPSNGECHEKTDSIQSEERTADLAGIARGIDAWGMLRDLL